MTAPTTPTVLGVYREMAIQNQRIVELAQVIARRAAADPANAQTIGFALIGSGMNVASEISSRGGAMVQAMLEVPDTEADLARLLSVQRDAAAAVIRELVTLFARFGWDLP